MILKEFAAKEKLEIVQSEKVAQMGLGGDWTAAIAAHFKR